MTTQDEIRDQFPLALIRAYAAADLREAQDIFGEPEDTDTDGRPGGAERRAETAGE